MRRRAVPRRTNVWVTRVKGVRQVVLSRRSRLHKKRREEKKHYLKKEVSG